MHQSKGAEPAPYGGRGGPRIRVCPTGQRGQQDSRESLEAGRHNTVPSLQQATDPQTEFFLMQ